MADRRVPVVVGEADAGFAPNLFTYRVFGSVRLGDRDWPAALEKIGLPKLWVIEFFQHDSPWSGLKPGDAVVFVVGPRLRVDLTVGDHLTEITAVDA